MKTINDYLSTESKEKRDKIITTFLAKANLGDGGEWLNFVTKYNDYRLVLPAGENFTMLLCLTDGKLSVEIRSDLYTRTIELKGEFTNEEISKIHDALLVANYCKPKSNDKYIYKNEKQNDYSQFIRNLTNTLLNYNKNKEINIDVFDVISKIEFNRIKETCRVNSIITTLIDKNILPKETIIRKYPRDIEKLDVIINKRIKKNQFEK